MLPVILTPTISGIKDATPIVKVEVAASPLTVRSLGLDARYYVFNGDAPTWGSNQLAYPVQTGVKAVCPLASLYFFEGQPATVPPLDPVANEKWAVVLSGYFMDPISTGNQDIWYTFYAAGAGHLTVSMSGQPVFVEVLNESSESFSESVVLLRPGKWYDFYIRFYQTSRDHSGFSLLWKSTQMSDPIPVSAGCTARPTDEVVDGEMPIPWQELRSVGSVSINDGVGESSESVVEVPLATANDYVGYQYQQNQWSVQCVEDGHTDLTVKKGHMIRVSMGYHYNDTDHFVERFTGNIKDFESARGKDSEEVIKITSHDFMSLCNNDISINYPQIDDYWNTYQIGDQSANGSTHWRTAAFDGWRLDQVFKAIFIKAGIDPTLFYKKRKMLDNTSTASNIGYLMEPMNSLGPKYNLLRLERNVKYGHPNSSIPQLQDATYIYKFDFGMRLGDILNNVAGNFGYTWGFNGYYEGAPYLSASNNPSYYLDDDQWAKYNGWTSELHTSAVSCTYSHADNGGSYALVIATGTRFDLINMVGSGFGSTDSNEHNVSWVITRMSDVTVVASGRFNSYHSDAIRGFYDGIDNNLGYNPCIRTLASGLPYERYSIRVERLDGMAPMALDGLYCYARDTKTPSVVFTTADTLDLEGNIAQLSVQDSADTIKNDIIVLGMSKIKYAPGSNVNGSYVQSRAIDLDGIHSPNSNRFMGRSNKMLIIENKIANEVRADYIAYQGLLRTYQASQTVNLGGLGNPLVELGDCITLQDPVKNVVNSGLAKWVKGVTIKFDKDEFTQEYELQSVELWPSYQPKAIVPSGLYGGHKIINFEITNGGFATRLVQELAADARTIPLSSNIPERDLFLVTRDYPTEVPDYNIIKVENEFLVVTGYQWNTNHYDLQVVPRGNIRGSAADVHASGVELVLPYDPYFSGNEFHNRRVKIKYFLTQDAMVSVELNGMARSILVANLTRPDLTERNADYELNKFIFQEAGWHTLEWDGIDQFGDWNGTGGGEAVGTYWRMPNEYGYQQFTYSGTLGRGYFVSEAPASDVTGASYAEFAVNITMVDPQSGNIIDSLTSTNVDRTWSPNVHGMNDFRGPFYGATICTMRGPMLNIERGPTTPTLTADNNWSGTNYLVGTENDGRGLKITVSSLYPHADHWDPPRHVVFQFGYLMRHVIAVRLNWTQRPVGINYDNVYHSQMSAFRDYQNPGYWGSYEMSPMDLYSGGEFYYPVNSLFNYGDTSFAPVRPSGIQWDYNAATAVIFSGFWHAWGFVIGGEGNGEFRDRSGRYRELLPVWGVWNVGSTSGYWRRHDLAYDNSDPAPRQGAGITRYVYYDDNQDWEDPGPYWHEQYGYGGGQNFIFPTYRERPLVLCAWYERR